MELQQAILKIRDLQTDGINCEITTEDIIQILQAWNHKCDFTIANVGKDTIEIRFQSLPSNLEAFCQEIYEFCPDIIDQGYDCIAEMIEMAEQTGQEINEEIKELIAGVDLNADNYGLELMKKDLSNKMQLTLWWD